MVLLVVVCVDVDFLSLSKQEEIAKKGINNTQNIHEHPVDEFLAISYNKNINKAHRHNQLNNKAKIQIEKKRRNQSSQKKQAIIKKITHPILFFIYEINYVLYYIIR